MTPPFQEPEPSAAPVERADPDWFREPTPREHWIGAGLFIGFGLFFAMLFVVSAGFWFRWVILGLGAYSVLHGLRHALDAARAKRDPDPPSNQPPQV